MQKNKEKQKNVCPECGCKLIYQQGCVQCSNPQCGYGLCG